MLHWLNDILKPDTVPGHTEVLINLMRYITFRAGVACLLAFGLSLLCGRWVIRKLISLKIGQPIRTADEVHKLAELHGGKAGTPTMGGVLIIGTVLFSVLLLSPLKNPLVLAVIFVMVGLGCLGFVDDYMKVSKKTSDGVRGKVKLITQAGVALAVGLFLMNHPDTSSYIRELHVPFRKGPLVEDMGLWCLPLFILVIVGCSNAVNLTDGLDGLAIGCTVTVAMAYAVFSYLVGHQFLGEKYLFLPYSRFSGELSVICVALIGAGLGFLWFNCHPAKVFMGDTGSLAIGGMLGTIAICCKHEIVLVIVGGVFVMEAGSVILQVASFKLRKKRIFRMSPIHHHFELKGWHENQVIIRFWTLSLIFAMIGLATLKLR
jgi:phospho-N-acetylmuramoyl-pentapeptide-transferase